MKTKYILLVVFQFMLIGSVICLPWFDGSWESTGKLSIQSTDIVKVILKMIGVILFIIGFVMAFGGAAVLNKNLTPFPMPNANGKLIENRWPYSISRNPIYLGLILMGYAWTIWNNSSMTFLVQTILWTLLHWKIHLEEKYLANKFGESYLKYISQVPRYLKTSNVKKLFVRKK